MRHGGTGRILRVHWPECTLKCSAAKSIPFHTTLPFDWWLGAPAVVSVAPTPPIQIVSPAPQQHGHRAHFWEPLDAPRSHHGIHRVQISTKIFPNYFNTHRVSTEAPRPFNLFDYSDRIIIIIISLQYTYYTYYTIYNVKFANFHWLLWSHFFPNIIIYCFFLYVFTRVIVIYTILFYWRIRARVHNV